jgi:hypothetical protein
VLVLAIVAVPVMAQDAIAAGGKGVDILGNGIFESGDNAFKFSILTDTNFDSITVGNDNARATAWDPAKAENNLEIKKNQQVGQCECCNKDNGDYSSDTSVSGEQCRNDCQDCCTTVNIEQVHVGDRNADASGSASAVNNVKLVLNQAP